MLNLQGTEYPDFTEYENNLSEDLVVFFDKLKTIHLLTYDQAVYYAMERNLVDLISFKSAGKYNDIDRQSLMGYLVDIEGIYEESLTKYDSVTKTRKPSLDMKEVMEPLASKGLAKEFFEWYMPWREYKSATETMAKKVNQIMKDSANVTNDEMPMLEVGYRLTRAETGRFYTKDDNIQAYPKRYLEAMTVPKGYFLVWGDFAQIDLRVAYHLYLREEGITDDIFQATKDKYEAMARLIHHTLKSRGLITADKEFDLEEFKNHRTLYKINTLASIYGAGLDTLMQAVSDREFNMALLNYLDNNKPYQAFISDLKDVITSGLSIEIEDYFGVNRSIPVDKKADNLTKGLNTPIQSTSNSIVMHLVNKTIQRFRDLGYGSDKIRVYLIRHDEPVFMVHVDCLKDCWIFNDYSKIQVDDWAELQCEPKFGFNYGVEDEKITNAYNIVSERNKDKMTPREITPRRKYSPIKKCFNVALETVKIPNNDSERLGVIYFPEIKSGIITKVADTDMRGLDVLVAKSIRYARDNDGMQIRIGCSLPDSLEFIDGVYVEIKNKRDLDIIRAETFLKYKLNEYLERAGKYDEFVMLTESDVRFSESVKELTV